MRLDENVVKAIQRATANNRSLHDGALMVGRLTKTGEYGVVGWSYRLFPPPYPGVQRQNRGAAFNSCLAMSNVRSVDCLILLGANEMTVFKSGRSRRLRDGS